jgi:YbbR domain-containing protein
VKFFRRATKDWYIKILSLALAFLLWMYVRSLKEKEMFAPVPLEVRNGHPQYVLSSVPPETVTVAFKGMEENLTLIEEEEMIAYVDLNGSTRNNLKRVVKLNETDIPRGVSVKEISPRMLDVTQEKAVNRIVEVAPVISGEPPYGYTLQDISVEPSRVEVRGPRSLMDSVDSVFTSEIDLGEVRETTVINANLETNRSTVHLVDPREVEVQLTIEEEFIIRKIVLNLRSAGLPEGYALESAESGITAVIKIPKRIERSFRESQVYARIDVSPVDGAGVYELPLSFETTNSDVVLIRMEPERLEVTVEEPAPEAETGGTGT